MQLSVFGLDPPTEEISKGLVGHLREKIEEQTMAKFARFLPQNPNTKLSPADIAFLRPASVPAVAAALIPLPPLLGQIEAGHAEWLGWLRSCGRQLRPLGWHVLTHTESADDTLMLLHVPPQRANNVLLARGINESKGLLCAFITLTRSAGDAQENVPLHGDATGISALYLAL